MPLPKYSTKYMLKYILSILLLLNTKCTRHPSFPVLVCRTLGKRNTYAVRRSYIREFALRKGGNPQRQSRLITCIGEDVSKSSSLNDTRFLLYEFTIWHTIIIVVNSPICVILIIYFQVYIPSNRSLISEQGRNVAQHPCITFYHIPVSMRTLKTVRRQHSQLLQTHTGKRRWLGVCGLKYFYIFHIC